MATDIVGHSLAENEATIKSGLTTFVDVGKALMEIRDQRQYIEAGFDSFEDYCHERWDMSKTYALNHIGSARVVAIATSSGMEVPSTEWAARPLVKVLNRDGEDAVREAWKQIIESRPDEQPVTGKRVRRFLGGSGVSFGKPGWHELLGEVSDILDRAQKQLTKFEEAIGDRPPAEELRQKAGWYKDQALDIVARLERIEG